tara:strand:- start:1289 stop:2404 length:1116 start_codon:yes stop_codon:yes gene_type:complete
MASSRGKVVRGAGGLFKRNVSLGISIGPPHGGEEGEIRLSIVNKQPRLYARAGNRWYNTPLYIAPIASIFEESSGLGTNLELNKDSSLTLQANRIICAGGVGRFKGESSPNRSIAIGDKSVMSNINSTVPHVDNIGIGASALEKGTEMQFNVAIGSAAMQNIGLHVDDTYADCYRNVAIGYAALQGNSSGRPQVKESVAIGTYAMVNADTISDAATMTCKWNVAMGYLAGAALEGSSNTCIGKQSGYSTLLANGSYNTLLGASTKTSAVDSANQIVIGYNAAGVADNTAVIGNDDITKVYMSEDQGAAAWLEHINMLERSSDPTEPTEGHAVVWMSNGSGKGDDGDVMIASQAGGATKYGTLFDHSGGSSW